MQRVTGRRTERGAGDATPLALVEHPWQFSRRRSSGRRRRRRESASRAARPAPVLPDARPGPRAF
ncbi:hypothetical protein PLANTIT3_70074 [Plantibacter sp. T3]|nr:hypothetical protein PLANTIT3_70074 [Plantibacter sp. T3]